MPVLDAFLLMAAVGGQLEVAPPPPLDPATPARTLECSLKRVVNIDLAKDQKPSDLVLEGHYPMRLTMPSAAAQKTQSYMLAADEGDWFAKAPMQFERVSDSWPTGVQLAAAAPVGFNFVILSAIDPAAGTAAISAGRGVDAAGIDPGFYFQGSCRITISPEEGKAP